MKKVKYYVVWKGKKTGVFNSWDLCKSAVHGFPDAKFKSFETKESADQAFQNPYKQYLDYRKKSPTYSKPGQKLYAAQISPPFLCVDAACSGNPGPTEYQGIWVDGLSMEKRKKVFHKKFSTGTNNIGEFLALVHALAWFKNENIFNVAVYSDSKIAINWVKFKKCKTHLKSNLSLNALIHRGEVWLKGNDLSQFDIRKWPTETWGEIPADFGRK